MLKINARLIFGVVGLALASLSTATAGQKGRPSMATLALSPTPLNGGHAVVLRRIGMTPHDVILLDSGGSETDLAAAVRMLGDMRVRFGDVPSNDLRAVVKNFTPGAKWRGGRDEAEHREKVRKLAKAPYQDVQGVGRVRGMPIVIPWPASSRPGKA